MYIFVVCPLNSPMKLAQFIYLPLFKVKAILHFRCICSSASPFVNFYSETGSINGIFIAKLENFNVDFLPIRYVDSKETLLVITCISTY